MADHSGFSVTELYTNLLNRITGRIDDVAKLFSGVTATNIPVGAIQVDENNQRFNKWTGTAWAVAIRSTLNSVLTGLSTTNSAAVTATDTVLAAFGKLQAQATNNANAISTNANNLISQAINSILIPLGYYPSITSANPPRIIRNTVAYAYNASGTLVAVPANTPVYEFDPVTAAYRGLRIEPASRNFIRFSEDYNNAYWNKQFASITTDGSLNKRGVTALKLTENTANNSHFFQFFSVGDRISVNAGDFVFCSAQFKSAGRDVRFTAVSDVNGVFTVGATYNHVTINLTDGTVSGKSTSANVVVTNLGNGWYDVRVRYVVLSAGSFSVQVVCVLPGTSSGLIYTGDGVSGVYIDAIEVKNNDSSYIPTNGTAVNRHADIASYAAIDCLSYAADYTPTPTNIANCASITAFTCDYIRNGNDVTVRGAITLTPTANNTMTELNIPLPIASNFTAVTNASGHARDSVGAVKSGVIVADPTADAMRFKYMATDTAATTFVFTAIYTVI